MEILIIYMNCPDSVGKRNYHIVGGFSKLFKYAIRNYNLNEILTYADLRFTNIEECIFE